MDDFVTSNPFTWSIAHQLQGSYTKNGQTRNQITYLKSENKIFFKNVQNFPYAALTKFFQLLKCHNCPTEGPHAKHGIFGISTLKLVRKKIKKFSKKFHVLPLPPFSPAKIFVFFKNKILYAKPQKTPYSMTPHWTR